MIKLKTVKDMGPMSREWDRLVDQVFFGQHARIGSRGQVWFPQMDVYETDNDYVVVCELPGLKADEIEILVDRTHVKISGRRNHPGFKNPVRIHHTEINYGAFQRVSRMPGPIEPDGVKASFENGMIEITMPKKKVVRKQLEIS